MDDGLEGEEEEVDEVWCQDQLTCLVWDLPQQVAFVPAIAGGRSRGVGTLLSSVCRRLVGEKTETSLGPFFISQEVRQACDVALNDERIVGYVPVYGTAVPFLVHASKSKKRE